jgi:hypothetical protein
MKSMDVNAIVKKPSSFNFFNNVIFSLFSSQTCKHKTMTFASFMLYNNISFMWCGSALHLSPLIYLKATHVV